MAVGTIIGSNIFNLLAIMGVAAAISAEPVRVSSRFLSFDLPVMVGASLVPVLLAWLGRPIGRRVGVTLVMAYFAYLGALYLSV